MLEWFKAVFTCLHPVYLWLMDEREWAERHNCIKIMNHELYLHICCVYPPPPIHRLYPLWGSLSFELRTLIGSHPIVINQSEKPRLTSSTFRPLPQVLSTIFSSFSCNLFIPWGPFSFLAAVLCLSSHSPLILLPSISPSFLSPVALYFLFHYRFLLL